MKTIKVYSRRDMGLILLVVAALSLWAMLN
jgi:hypothetical protein